VTNAIEPVSVHRILILDDEQTTLEVLQKILSAAGFSEVRGVTDPRRALAQIQEFQPDILLLDIQMPHLDGFAVLRQVRHRIGESEYFPVLVISGEMSSEVKKKALAEGAKDFLAKPYDAVEVVLRVRNLLETRDLNRRLQQRVRTSVAEVRSTHLALAERLALAAELRDHGRGWHTRRVGRTAARIAAELSLPDDEVESIARAAQLHDIGMIGIPDAIVLKPDQLTLDEWDVLKTHTILGARLLGGGESPILRLAEEIALYHHENWDGTGYTPGLGGEEIPLAARIAAVADVFDSLIHDRPYAKGWPVDDSVEWIADQKGQKFDPAVVEAFLRTDPRSMLPPLEDDAPLRDLVQPFQTNFSGPEDGGQDAAPLEP
jgi:putative two-component system response regulator